MSRIRTLSARSVRITGHRTRGEVVRVRKILRGRPLSPTEWVILVAWACVLQALVWAVLLIGVIRTIRQTL
jgi:hypothetical protein